LLDAALSDKKRRGGEITLVVPEAIGRCSLRRVPVEDLCAWVAAGLA
jgi:3-dehydroquinate synthase